MLSNYFTMISCTPNFLRLFPNISLFPIPPITQNWLHWLVIFLTSPHTSLSGVSNLNVSLRLIMTGRSHPTWRCSHLLMWWSRCPVTAYLHYKPLHNLGWALNKSIPLIRGTTLPPPRNYGHRLWYVNCHVTSSLSFNEMHPAPTLPPSFDPSVIYIRLKPLLNILFHASESPLVTFTNKILRTGLVQINIWNRLMSPSSYNEKYES